MLAKVVDSLINMEVDLEHIAFMILEIILAQLVILLKQDGLLMVSIFMEDILVQVQRDILLL